MSGKELSIVDWGILVYGCAMQIFTSLFQVPKRNSAGLKNLTINEF